MSTKLKLPVSFPGSGILSVREDEPTHYRKDFSMVKLCADI